jgi:hypothetical protein
MREAEMVGRGRQDETITPKGGGRGKRREIWAVVASPPFEERAKDYTQGSLKMKEGRMGRCQQGLELNMGLAEQQ